MLKKGDYEVAHGGYDPVPGNENPNRVLPLDVARACQKENRCRHYDEKSVQFHLIYNNIGAKREMIPFPAPGYFRLFA